MIRGKPVAMEMGRLTDAGEHVRRVPLDVWRPFVRSTLGFFRLSLRVHRHFLPNDRPYMSFLFGFTGLFKICLLLTNAVAILSEDRFLARSKQEAHHK